MDYTLLAYERAQRNAREQLACVESAATWSRVVDWCSAKAGAHLYDDLAVQMDAVLAHAVAMAVARDGSAGRLAHRAALDVAASLLATAIIERVAEGLQRKCEAEVLAELNHQDDDDSDWAAEAAHEESVRRAEP